MRVSLERYGPVRRHTLRTTKVSDFLPKVMAMLSSAKKRFSG